MKYNGMPAGMWMLFKKQFHKALVVDLGYDLSDAKRIAKAAKPKYREIIDKLPEFEKDDRFKTNIVNWAVLQILSGNIHWLQAVRIVTADIRRKHSIVIQKQAGGN